MTDNTELADKVVLVTGASRGIGYAAGIEAAKRGAHRRQDRRRVARSGRASVMVVR